MCSTKNKISVKKLFYNVRFISAQNTVFRITNAGKKNLTFILVTGALESKNQELLLLSDYWYKCALKRMSEFMVPKMARVQPQPKKLFYFFLILT